MLAIASVRLCGAASNAQALGLGQALRGKDKSIHIILNYLLAGVPTSSFVLLLSTTARHKSNVATRPRPRTHLFVAHQTINTSTRISTQAAMCLCESSGMLSSARVKGRVPPDHTASAEPPR